VGQDDDRRRWREGLLPEGTDERLAVNVRQAGIEYHHPGSPDDGYVRALLAIVGCEELDRLPALGDAGEQDVAFDVSTDAEHRSSASGRVRRLDI
jgi:hypothetical protein